MKKEEKKEIEKIEYDNCSFSLITTEGKIIFITYQIPMGSDDEVLEEFLDAIDSNEIFCPTFSVEINFLGQSLDEVDMKKVIGIRW